MRIQFGWSIDPMIINKNPWSEHHELNFQDPFLLFCFGCTQRRPLAYFDYVHRVDDTVLQYASSRAGDHVVTRRRIGRQRLVLVFFHHSQDLLTRAAKRRRTLREFVSLFLSSLYRSQFSFLEQSSINLKKCLHLKRN